MSADAIVALAFGGAGIVTFLWQRHVERRRLDHELGWKFEDRITDLYPDLWRLRSDTHSEASLVGHDRHAMVSFFQLYSQVWRASRSRLLADHRGDWNGLRKELYFWMESSSAQAAWAEIVRDQPDYWPRGFASFVAQENQLSLQRPGADASLRT